MDAKELENLLNQAAEKGAMRALERVGLQDDDAGRDIQDLRSLIEGWRDAKKAVVSTLMRYITVGILGALAFGVWTSLRGK